MIVRPCFTDNETRRIEHLTGKQYLGWMKIRELRDAVYSQLAVYDQLGIGGWGGGGGYKGSKPWRDSERDTRRDGGGGGDTRRDGGGGGGGDTRRDGGGGGGGGGRDDYRWEDLSRVRFTAQLNALYTWKSCRHRQYY
jgi:hypothetical protein